MSARRISLFGLMAVALVALVVAGCGGSSSTNASATTLKTPDGKTATIGVSSTDLGKILTNSAGHTVYLFKKDTGTKSTCTGACASAWPPVRVTGKPTAASGVKASLLGTTKRSDGKPQVTYHGHPVYLFQGDGSPGATSGQAVNAFGAAWYVVSPAGNQITTKPASTSGGSPSGY